MRSKFGVEYRIRFVGMEGGQRVVKRQTASYLLKSEEEAVSQAEHLESLDTQILWIKNCETGEKVWEENN